MGRAFNNQNPEGLHKGQKKVAVQSFLKKSCSESQLHLHMDSEWSSLMGFAFFKMFSIRGLLNSSQGFSLLLYKILAQKSWPTGENFL